MKLRIRDNSIRLRLTQSEVATAGNGDAVSGAVEFGGSSRFVYALQGATAADSPRAAYTDNALTVSVPVTVLKQWAGSNDVSISGTQRADDGGELQILIEKDFACLAPRDGEDESDMYPHPEAGQTTC